MWAKHHLFPSLILSRNTYQVNWTVAGPATFDGSSATTYSSADIGSNAATATVYSQQATAGPISVTASATGLTTGSLTLNAVQTGTASALKVAVNNGGTATGLSNGTFGVSSSDTNAASVTVSLLDKNGNVTTAGTTDTVTLTFASVTGAPVQGASSNVFTQTIAANASSATFYIDNTTAGSYSFTVADTNGSTSGSGSVAYVAGTPTNLVLSPNLGDFIAAPVSDTLGLGAATQTLTAQVTDAQGNNVALSGVPVLFTVTPSSNVATASLDGAVTTAGSAVAVKETVYTNANGVATAHLTAQNYNTDTYNVTVSGTPAGFPAALTSDYTLNFTVGSYPVASLKASFASAQMTTDATSSDALTISKYDANGITSNATDTLLVSVPSNSGLLVKYAAGTAGTSAQGPDPSLFTVVPSSSTVAGTYAVTVQDISVSSQPSTTATLSVTTGAPVNLTATGSAFVNGTDTITTAGVYPVTLEVTDFGGNLVSSTGNVALSLGNVKTVLNNNLTITGFRTSQNGSDVTTTTTLPAGTSSLTIWVEASSNLVATSTGLGNLGNALISSAVLNTAANTVTITFNESIDPTKILPANLATDLALGTHTWGTTTPAIAWSNNNTVLTVTLGTAPSVAVGDTITPAGTVLSTYGALVTGAAIQ